MKNTGPASRREMLLAILTLGLPSMLDQLMGTAVQYIDTAMVGSLGTAATAAVGSTVTVWWLIGNSLSALGVGFLARISQAFGAGEDELARRTAAQVVTTVLIVGSLFTLIAVSLSPYVPVWMQLEREICPIASQYFLILSIPMVFRAAAILFDMVLYAAGDMKTPMRVGIFVNLLNVLLNTLCIYPSRTLTLWGHSLRIFGFGMGVLGAALASAVSISVGAVVITVYLFRHPKVSPRHQSFRPDWAVLRPCMVIAAPNMGQRFITCFGYVAFASMINTLGGVATAAHTVANTVESLFYIPGFGMQTATATLAGNAVGERSAHKLRELGRVTIPLEITMMGVSGLLLFVSAPQLVRLFAKDPEVVRLAATVLRMVAVSEPFYGVPIVLEGMLQGCGQTREPFFFNIAGMWGVRILGTFVCTQLLGLGLTAAWGCMIGHNLLLFVLFVSSYTRKVRRRTLLPERA